MKISRRLAIVSLLGVVTTIVLGLPNSGIATSIWSEDFEGATEPGGFPEGWRVRPVAEGGITAETRPHGSGRCLHLAGPERGMHRVALPRISVRPGRSYLLRWETRADGIWNSAGLRFGTNKGPRRADGATLSGTDSWTSRGLHIFVANDETELRCDLSMEGEGSAWFDNFRLELYEWPRMRKLPENVVFRLPQAGRAEICYNYPIVRVAPGHELPANVPEAGKIHIECAANEREAFQLMLGPWAEVTGLKLSVSDLRGPATFPADAWEIFQVGVVPVPVVKVYHTSSLLGETPAPLLPKESFDLKAGGWTCLWVQVETPPGAPAGAYRGIVSLSEPIQVEVPIEVEVFGFSLPEEPSLEESAGFRFRQASRASGIDEDTLRQLVIERYRRDRIDWPRLFGIMLQSADWVRLKDGGVVIDFEKFDQTVETYHKLGFRSLDIPPTNLRARGPHGQRMRPWLGVTPLTDEFDRAFGDYIVRVGAHLKEKGWLEQSSIYLWAEPQEREYDDYIRVAGAAERAFPGLHIKMAGPRFPSEPLYGFVDIWYPNMRWYSLDCYAERIRERQALGELVGGYGNNRYNLDYPLLFQRVWPWTLKLYGLTRHGWWEIAGRSANPYERTDMPSGRPGDTRSNTPGAQYFLYPPIAEGGSLVSSMRWEMLRQGREDYEYFTILEKLIDAHEGQGKGRTRVKELIRQAVWGNLDWQYCQDPLVPHQLRRQVAEEIVELLSKQSQSSQSVQNHRLEVAHGIQAQVK